MTTRKDEGGKAAHAGNGGIQYEVITVLVRQDDYASLKREGGPQPDQIAMALQHYLLLIRESKWRAEMNNELVCLGKVTTFKCVVEKKLYEEIRALGGRLDHHTVEAVRLYML
jgi:hypothetical protein